MANKYISQYQIKSAIVKADRYGTYHDMQIGNLIFELNFMEDITKSYITGQMLVVDKGGLFANFRFTGSERVEFELMGMFGDQTDTPIKKTFIIRGKNTSASDNSVFVFDLIEEHGFLGTTKVISKSYNGEKEQIVEKILKGQLNKEIDTSYLTPTLDGKTKLLIPNCRVLDAVRNLVDHMYSKDGSPYFLYSSLYSEVLRLGSFEKMLSLDPVNNKTPYTYAPAHTQSTHDNPHDFAQNVMIESYDVTNNANEHFLAQVGANGSLIDATDISSTFNNSHHVYGREKLNHLLRNDNDVEQNQFDANFQINNEYVEELDSRKIHQITSEKTYIDCYPCDHTVSDALMKNKVFANSIKHMLSANMINIQVPGTAIMRNRVMVGDNINLRFRKIDETESKYDDVWDRDLTGNYFITNIKHIFKEGKHTTVMSVSKIVREVK